MQNNKHIEADELEQILGMRPSDWLEEYKLLHAYIAERERKARLIELDLLEQALNDGRDLNKYKLYRLDSLNKECVRACNGGTVPES